MFFRPIVSKPSDLIHLHILVTLVGVCGDPTLSLQVPSQQTMSLLPGPLAADTMAPVLCWLAKGGPLLDWKSLKKIEGVYLFGTFRASAHDPPSPIFSLNVQKPETMGNRR